MRSLKSISVAMMFMLSLTACGDSESTQGQPESSQGQTKELSAKLSDNLAKLLDFDTQLTEIAASEPALEIYSYVSGALFPASCESGKNELFNALDSEIVGFYVPVDFDDETRNNTFTIFQEGFRFGTLEEVTDFMNVVQNSATDENLCSVDNSMYSELISGPTKLSVDDYGLAGISWYEESSYKTTTFTCGAKQAIFRTVRWVQSSETDVYITTAQGVECNSGDGTEEYVETVRLGELAAKSIKK